MIPNRLLFSALCLATLVSPQCGKTGHGEYATFGQGKDSGKDEQSSVLDPITG